MPSTSSPLSLPGMGRNGARCSSSAQQLPQVVPSPGEHRGAVRCRRRRRARGPGWAARRPRATAAAPGPAGWPARSTVASRSERLLAAVLGLDPLAAQAVRADRPQEVPVRARPSMSASSSARHRAGPRGRRARKLVCRPYRPAGPRRRRPGARSSRSRRRRPTAPRPSLRTADRLVWVGGRLRRVPEGRAGPSFHRSWPTAWHVGPAIAVRCPARRGAGRGRRRPRGRRGRVRSGPRSGARTGRRPVGLVAPAEVPVIIEAPLVRAWPFASSNPQTPA